MWRFFYQKEASHDENEEDGRNEKKLLLVHSVNDASRDRPRADGPDLKTGHRNPRCKLSVAQVIHDEDWQSGYPNLL